MSAIATCPPRRSFRLRRVFTLLALCSWLLVLSGCTISPNAYKGMMSYKVSPMPTRIEAKAGLEVSHTLSPEMRAYWKQWLNNDQTISNYESAVRQVIVDDLTHSGLFTDTALGSSKDRDFLIKVSSEELKSSDMELKVTLVVSDPSDGNVISTFSRSQPGTISSTSLQAVMNALKGDVYNGLKDEDLQGLKEKRLAANNPVPESTFENATLESLLVAKETSLTTARLRNHALIRAKTDSLPAILKEKKTKDLTQLNIKFEQTILDLNHEKEVEKDRAQRAVEAGKNADRMRELALVYNERIEILKPILGAIKEEISNRAK